MKALASAALGLLWGSIMIMLCEIMFWLHYGYVVAASMTAASARGEAMLWPLCEPGENKCVCNSYTKKNPKRFCYGASERETEREQERETTRESERACTNNGAPSSFHP